MQNPDFGSEKLELGSSRIFGNEFASGLTVYIVCNPKPPKNPKDFLVLEFYNNTKLNFLKNQG